MAAFDSFVNLAVHEVLYHIDVHECTTPYERLRTSLFLYGAGALRRVLRRAS